MSGGGTPKHNSSGGEENECLDLWLNTKIASPNSSVISTLSINDTLDVALSNGSVVVLASSGAIAGAIIGRDAIRLKKCLEKNSDFFARVTAISGGSCDVIIKCAHQ